MPSLDAGEFLAICFLASWILRCAEVEIFPSDWPGDRGFVFLLAAPVVRRSFHPERNGAAKENRTSTGGKLFRKDLWALSRSP